MTERKPFGASPLPMSVTMVTSESLLWRSPMVTTRVMLNGRLVSASMWSQSPSEPVFDSNGVMSIGMGFTQGQISMNALYSTDSDRHEADNEAVAKTGPTENKAATGTLSNPVMTNAPDLKNQAMGVDMTYQMSEATSLVLVAAQHKHESARAYLDKSKLNAGSLADGGDVEAHWVKSSTTVDAFGVGFSHDLGGGATLKAGAGSVDSNAVADLGITMKF